MTDPFARTMRLLDETARIIRERDQLPAPREVFTHMHWCVVACKSLRQLDCDVVLVKLNAFMTSRSKTIGTVPVETEALEVIERFDGGARSHILDLHGNTGAERILEQFAARTKLPVVPGVGAIETYKVSDPVIPASVSGALSLLNPDMQACVAVIEARLRALDEQDQLQQTTPVSPSLAPSRRI